MAHPSGGPSPIYTTPRDVPLVGDMTAVPGSAWMGVISGSPWHFDGTSAAVHDGPSSILLDTLTSRDVLGAFTVVRRNRLPKLLTVPQLSYVARAGMAT